MNLVVGLSLAAAGLGICYAAWCARWILSQEEGVSALQSPYRAIRDAAQAFLRTQYTTIFKVGLVFVVVLAVVPHLGVLTAVGFAVGGLCSALAGAAGMWVAVRANVRTAAAAIRGVCSAGLAATALPAASAATTWPVKMATGKFHGLMTPTTPLGW